MNKFRYLLNAIHYCFYRFDHKLHMLSNKLNPLLLLGKIPMVKKKFIEKGTTHLDVYNKIWTDPRFGFGITIAGSALCVMLFLIILAVYLIINKQFPNPIAFSWQPFGLCMGLSFSICYYLVFRNNNYIVFFKKFERWSKIEKRKYCLLSFIFTLLSLVLFIYSFKFLT